MPQQSYMAPQFRCLKVKHDLALCGEARESRHAKPEDWERVAKKLKLLKLLLNLEAEYLNGRECR